MLQHKATKILKEVEQCTPSLVIETTYESQNVTSMKKRNLMKTGQHVHKIRHAFIMKTLAKITYSKSLSNPKLHIFQM